MIAMRRLACRRIQLSLALAVTGLCISTLAACADDDEFNPDRPGIADGSTTIGRHFAIETGVQRERRHQGPVSARTLFIPTLFRFGINDTWELRLEGNTYTHTRVSDPATGVQRSAGYGPESVGVKYHFQDSGGVSRPSLGTILRIFAPSGSSNFRTHHVTGDLRLVADWDLAPPHWSLNPNVGLAVYEGDSGETFTAGLFALTVNYVNTRKNLNPFVDMGLQTPEQPGGRASIIVDTGLAYLVNHNIQLDFSVGTGVGGRTPPHPFWAAGFSERF